MARTEKSTEAGDGGGSGWLAWLVALPLATLTALALGALTLDRTAAPTAVAVVVALLGALAAPGVIDALLTRAYRRLDPQARSVGAQVIAAWCVAVLAALALAAPSALGRALQSRGDWMFPNAHGGAPDAARSTLRSVGARLSGRPAVDAADAGVADAHVDAGAPAARPATTHDAGADAAPPIPTDRDLTPQEIFRLRADAVVVITARGRPDPHSVLARFTGITAPVVSGSGFVVDADGLVVTNEHVVHGAESVAVTLRDGRALTPVTLLAVDRAHDLALLRVDARGLATAPVSQDDAVAVGTHATAIGSPLGLSYTLTDGLVSAMRDVEGTSFLQIETAIAPGSSGGPLFDPRGRVIGVTTATTGAASMNLALNPRYVRALLARDRSPRALAAFAPDAAVVDLALQGAEASPVERLELDGGAKLLAAGLEGCRPRAPRATRITLGYDTSRGDAGDGFDGLRVLSRRPRVDSDLGDDGAACLRQNLELVGMRFANTLLHEHNDEVAAGRALTVSFTVRFGRDDAGARDVAVRYEFAPRPTGGDDDGGQ